jgi:hypothetical protein
MAEEGEGGFALCLEEDGGLQAAEQARLIERAVAKGFEALDVDGRIEQALNRRESAGSRQSGGSSTRLTMGVMPGRGALNGISVSNEPTGASGSTATTLSTGVAARPGLTECMVEQEGAQLGESVPHP